MNSLIGKHAPNFTAKAIMGDNAIEENFNLKKYADGQKCVLLFYPLDFTFVCPSEIISVNNKLGVLCEKKTKIIGISIDSHFSHLAWKKTPLNKGGIGDIKFPLVSDITKNIATDYKVLHDEGIAYRGTFIIDEDFVIRHILVNDLPLGRNINEVIRMIDAIEYHKKHGEVCPAGWQEGQEGMTPTEEGVAHYLTSHSSKL